MVWLPIRVRFLMLGHMMRATSGHLYSGVPMPVGDIPGWHQIFAEDFLTPVALGDWESSSYHSSNSGPWDGYTGFNDTSHNGFYDNSILSVHNSCLDMYIHTSGGTHYVAAPMPILPGLDAYQGQSYGRYTVRFKADPLGNGTSGYKTAWLLWPDDGVWPDHGEIDFPEGGLDGSINAYAHYADPGGGQDPFEGNPQTYREWHTTTIEWLPDHLEFFIDGISVGTSTNEVPPGPMYFILQTETYPIDVGATPPPDYFTGHLLIDWIAIYEPA